VQLLSATVDRICDQNVVVSGKHDAGCCENGSRHFRFAVLFEATILQTENVLTTVREGRGRRAAIVVFRELIALAEGKPV
jgi:hypothetical protein